VNKTYAYEPYGATVTAMSGGVNTYQYTGRENDNTGLYYYRARYYHPRWGRFISSDPIGVQGGLNTYAYAMDNPVNWIDPLGLEITVCNRKVSGFPFVGNHSYAWDTTTNTAEGMRGSSGSDVDSNETGPRVGGAGDRCNVVKGSEGKEKDIMDFMRDNQNNGIWFPFANDCHNAIQDAVENAGLQYPGAPGGRFGAPR
jgi:RHS repeat-associated protein